MNEKNKKTDVCMHSTKVQTLKNSLKVLQELHEALSVCAEFPFALPYDLDFISIFSALFCS
jgi:hypothetical protein